MNRITTIAALAVLLSACSDTSHEPTATSAPSSVPSPANESTGTSGLPAAFRKDVIVSMPDFMAPNVKLSVTPNPYDACKFPKGEATVTIEYDARDAGAKHTQLWFQRSNGKQVLWGQAPGRMSANPTGNWAHEGMKVLLVDVDAGVLLAVTTIHADDCK